MKLRTQFIINMVVLGSILLLVSAAVIVTSRWVENTHQQQKLAKQIEREAYELGNLANNYLLYRERQQASRWESKFDSFSDHVSNLQVGTPEQQVVLAKLKSNQQRLKAVFGEVEASIESAPEMQQAGFDEKLMRVSWSRLAVQNQELIFDTSRLEGMLSEQEHEFERLARLLSFVLIGSLGIFLLVNYGLTFRRILQAMTTLQAGFRIIGSGALDHGISVKNHDEIGELSHAFNRMTRQLKTITASRAELEREITERKRVEEALRRSEALLLQTSKMAKIGGWELDLQTMKPVWSLETYRIHEVDPSVQPDLENAINYYAPAARPVIREAVQRAIEDGQSYDLELPFVTAKGKPIWIRTMGQAEFRDGKCMRLIGTFEDITAHKQAEEALQESEAKYRNLFENMTEEVHFWQLVRDETGSIKTWRLVDANPPTLKTWGRKSVWEIKGKTTDEIFGAGATDHYMPVVQRIMTDGIPYSFEDYFPHLGKHFRFTSVPVDDYFITTGADITSIKKAEQELRESEQRLKRAQEIAHLGSWELDLINNQLIWSDEVYRIFGLQPQEFGATYEAFLEAVHPEDRTAVDAAYSGSIQAGQDSYEIEHRVVRRSSGEVRIVHEKCEHFRNQSGQIIRSIGMVHDITERKQAEAEIASLAKFPTENPNPVLRAQNDGKITYANAASQEMLEVWGCEIDDYLPQALRDFITVAVDDNSNKTADLPCNDKVYAIMFVPILENGYVNIYGRDITERKRAEEALHGLAEELSRSNAELEQFAYVASHDLQEPLRMISSYVQLLGRRYQGKLDSDADEFIGFAVDGAKRMQSLINDLLAFSRVGTQGNPPTLFSAEELVKEALDNLQFSIEESGATITYESLPVIKGDSTQLVMVFQNLLGNAIKFHGSAAPCIHIGAQREGDEWIFSVRDNGIGLDPQFAERIFVIFQRLHNRSSYPGTGIGLAICKRIIQRHRGRIWVESKAGEGATFYFTLPVKETV